MYTIAILSSIVIFLSFTVRPHSMQSGVKNENTTDTAGNSFVVVVCLFV